MSNHQNEIDFAIRQFLHRRFVPRPGVTRTGRRFSPDDMPDDDGRYEGILQAQSLFVSRLITRHCNPCDDVYEVEANTRQRCAVRMEWLREYWQEARG